MRRQRTRSATGEREGAVQAGPACAPDPARRIAPRMGRDVPLRGSGEGRLPAGTRAWSRRAGTRLAARDRSQGSEISIRSWSEPEANGVAEARSFKARRDGLDAEPVEGVDKAAVHEHVLGLGTILLGKIVRMFEHLRPIFSNAPCHLQNGNAVRGRIVVHIRSSSNKRR